MPTIIITGKILNYFPQVVIIVDIDMHKRSREKFLTANIHL